MKSYQWLTNKIKHRYGWHSVMYGVKSWIGVWSGVLEPFFWSQLFRVSSGLVSLWE